MQGSDDEPYRVTVVLGPRGSIPSYGCTCPYDWGGACKHVVATLLAYQHSPQQVEERAPLPTLQANLDAGQLRQLLLNLAGSLPAATEVIEAEVANLRRPPQAQRQAKPERKAHQRGRRPRRPNPANVRRQVIAALHSLDGMRRSEAYWHVPEVVARVRAVAEQAVKPIAAGNSRGALTWAQRLAGWQNELRDYEMDDVFDEPLAILLGQWDGTRPARLDALRVIETYGHVHPEWALTACSAQAQRLLEQGTAKDYDEAVRWLALAQAAAKAAGRLAAWQADLDELMARHSRKRRLVALLGKLRRRRRPR